MLREEVKLIEAQVAYLDVPPPDTDPATRCGVTKPLSEQTDDELVVTFRSADQAKRQGLNAALAAAFICADVVAVLRKRPNRPNSKQVACILGVEPRTAENYHTLYTRYPDPSKRPTDCSQRDLNVAFREVKRLMPSASKGEIAQAAAEQAKKKRLERPAKKPRGRAAAKKSGGAPAAVAPLPLHAGPPEPAPMPLTKDPSAGPMGLSGTHPEGARDAYATAMAAIDSVYAYLASNPPKDRQRSVVNALKDILSQFEAPRATTAPPEPGERDTTSDDEDDAEVDADDGDPEEESDDDSLATGDWSDDDDDDDLDYEPGD